MARGYKTVDDPLEGILGSVLKLQQLQEGHDRSEQLREDRFYKKLDYFEKNIDLTNADSMDRGKKLIDQYVSNNRNDMSSEIIQYSHSLSESIDSHMKSKKEAEMLFADLDSWQVGLLMK